MKNTNKIWTFGDSFTKFDYLKVDESIRNQIILWPDIVGNEMNLPVENMGRIAACNSMIIGSVLENCSKFEKGDYIIIGLSTPFRTLVVRDGKVESFLNQDYIFSKSQEDKIVYDYVSNVLYPNEELINQYYWKQINGLKALLKKMECNVFLWDYTFWEKFETNKKATKGKETDPHWSKKGHEDMAKYILEKLNIKQKNTI
jgi:hypothetical protein